MQDSESSSPTASKRTPWNKGKLTGAKPPLRPKHVWSIRSKLQMADRKRDLALFNLAIDSKLRGCSAIRRLLHAEHADGRALRGAVAGIEFHPRGLAEALGRWHIAKVLECPLYGRRWWHKRHRQDEMKTTLMTPSRHWGEASQCRVAQQSALTTQQTTPPRPHDQA